MGERCEITYELSCSVNAALARCCVLPRKLFTGCMFCSLSIRNLV